MQIRKEKNQVLDTLKTSYGRRTMQMVIIHIIIPPAIEAILS